jgi:hypothetical protein
MRILILLLVLCHLGAGEAERYSFLPDQPKWLTANLDVRDASEALWPNLIGGRNAAGEAAITAEGVSGAFTVRFNAHSQFEGGQSRRVLGDEVRDKPEAELVVKRLHASVAVDAADELDSALGAAKKKAKRPEPPKQAALEGELIFLGRTVAVATTAELKRDGDRLMISGSFTIPGAQLGLRPERLLLSFGITGYRSAADRKARLDTPELKPDLPGR